MKISILPKFKPEDYKKNSELFKFFSLVTDLGFVFIAPILLFTISGNFIVGHFSLPRPIIILFILVGLFLSSYMIFKKIKKIL